MGAIEALEPEDPRQVGRYQIVARLGSGGMGQVYLARSAGGRPVAVKVVRPELARDGNFRRRFAREVIAARRVNGAFTAGVIDADPDGSPAWLATVYVPGVSLAEAIAWHGPWSVQSVLALGAGLAEALGAIHSAGVVHRDLKPSNVLLAADGPRVIDFGISVASEVSALTSVGMVIGTPGFMSPEQLTGEMVGPASDIFALGTVLAYTATGVGPFGTGTPHALHFRAVYEQPNLDPFPHELRHVVAACLAKEPDQRPTAGVLLDQLATVGGGDEGQETAAATQLLTGPGWMPGRVAQLVRERTSTSLPPASPSSLSETLPTRPAADQLAPDAPASTPSEASLPPSAEPPHPPPPLLPAVLEPAPEAHQPQAPAGEQPRPVLPPLAPETSDSDSAEQSGPGLARNGDLADSPGAPEPTSESELGPHRRMKLLSLVAALVVALAAAGVLVLVSPWEDSDSDSKGGKADRPEQTSPSRDPSPSEMESGKVGSPDAAKLPAPCKSISQATIERLVPSADNRDGTIIGNSNDDLTSIGNCAWKGLKVDNAKDLQYRWLDITLSRYASDATLGRGVARAEVAYMRKVDREKATGGAQNVKTDPVPAIGDEATCISYERHTDGDVFREATVVVRTGSTMVALHYSGAGFLGTDTADSGTIVNGATTAAKEAAESVAKASR